MARRLHAALMFIVAPSWLAACERSADPPPTAGSTASTAGVASATAAAAGPLTRAVITVDEAHDVTRKDGVPYAIAPSQELVLEPGSHRFARPDAAASAAPNAVHVAHGPTAYYRATWSGKGAITLNAASLESVRGRAAFPGFEAGEQYIVAVGAEAPSAADGAMRFAPVWTTKISVTAP